MPAALLPSGGQLRHKVPTESSTAEPGLVTLGLPLCTLLSRHARLKRRRVNGISIFAEGSDSIALDKRCFGAAIAGFRSRKA